MLEYDLREFKCPQQFVQFKLGLNQACSKMQQIKFVLLLSQPTQDMEIFLQKHHFYYQLDQQQGLLFVEPLRV